MITLRPGGSFRTQLVVLTSAVTAIGVVVLILVVQVVLGRSASGSIDTVLSDRVDAVVGSASSEGGTLRVPGSQLDAGVAVYDDRGHLAAGAAPRSLLSVYADLATTSTARTVDLPDEDRVLGRPFTLADGTRGVVVVTESAAPYERAETQALWLCLGAGALMVLLAAVLAAWVSRRALAPVVTMSRSAEDWSLHDLSHRFDLGPEGNELNELGRTLDRLLGRVADAIRSEQLLTSELAHELRTPLASIQGNAELALDGADAGPETRDSLAEIVAGCHRMSATIDGLLELARSDAAAPSGSCLLTDVLAEAVAVPHRSGSVSYDVDPDLRIALDQVLAARAVGPVIDNAARHGSHVRVTARQAARGYVEVLVDDDGPGVAAEDREAVFTPGRTTTGGAGLGLPLARRVARTAGGDVVLADGPMGTRVVVRLPAR